MASSRIGRAPPRRDYGSAPATGGTGPRLVQPLQGIVIEHDAPVSSQSGLDQPPGRAGVPSLATVPPVAGTPGLVDVVRSILGIAVVEDKRKFEAILHAKEVLDKQLERIWQAGSNVGEALLDLREILSEQEFRKTIQESARLFPGWSRSNLVKLVASAELVRSGRVELHELPEHMSTRYLISTLTPEEIERARGVGLLKPTVKRHQIAEFKRELGNSSSDEPEPMPSSKLSPDDLEQIRVLNDRLRALIDETKKVRRERNDYLAGRRTVSSPRLSKGRTSS